MFYLCVSLSCFLQDDLETEEKPQSLLADKSLTSAPIDWRWVIARRIQTDGRRGSGAICLYFMGGGSRDRLCIMEGWLNKCAEQRKLHPSVLRMEEGWRVKRFVRPLRDWADLHTLIYSVWYSVSLASVSQQQQLKHKENRRREQLETLSKNLKSSSIWSKHKDRIYRPQAVSTCCNDSLHYYYFFQISEIRHF